MVNPSDPTRPVTIADLEKFKHYLLKEIKKIVGIQHTLSQRPWLKSYEVRKMLKISSGTLQHLRDSGQLKFSKVGEIIFYVLKDIEDMMKQVT